MTSNEYKFLFSFNQNIPNISDSDQNSYYDTLEVHTNIINDDIIEKIIQKYPNQTKIRFHYYNNKKPPSITPPNTTLNFCVSFDIWSNFVKNIEYLEFYCVLINKQFKIHHLLVCSSLIYLYIGATNYVLFDGELVNNKIIQKMNNSNIRYIIFQGFGIVKYDHFFNKIIENIRKKGGFFVWI